MFMTGQFWQPVQVHEKYVRMAQEQGKGEPFVIAVAILPEAVFWRCFFFLLAA